MLDLSWSHPSFDRWHQRFQAESLPDTLGLDAFAGFDPGAFDDAALRWGRAAWQARALDEYRSQGAFTDLLAELTGVGCAFDILGAAIRIVRDEARHVELCRRMVVCLGGDSRMPGAPSFVNPEAGLSPLVRILQTTVGFLCVGETLSMRLIAGVRDNTSDPLARALMSRLAADESIHSRFGWTLLEVLGPFAPAQSQEERTAVLERCFAGVQQAVVASAGDARDEVGPRNPFGYLGAEQRLAIFEMSMRRDVLPRFEALGYPALRAWARRGF